MPGRVPLGLKLPGFGRKKTQALCLYSVQLMHMRTGLRSCCNGEGPLDLFDSVFMPMRLQCHTHTSFIIISNKGRLPASGLGAKRPEQHALAQAYLLSLCSLSLSLAQSRPLAPTRHCGCNVRFIKDCVICHGRAPEHTTTYSRGTFSEDAFDMEKWRSGLQIKILEIAEDDVCSKFF